MYPFHICKIAKMHVFSIYLWSMINMDNIKKHQKYKKRKYFRSLLTFNNKFVLDNGSAFYTKEGDLDGKKIFYLDNTLCLLLLIKL